ncbi:uncharacterized protein LOC117336745 isoform X2 [Pecten maximus]|uniref:uncharacterized protein LOC117336745 isoform X2 n=1 Tax=Pecten maximus TaxID=6579 RepID=UPI001458E7CB|nr:uncharacterized protein LOC117336745 isoform X2 [Pecten maximus]
MNTSVFLLLFVTVPVVGSSDLDPNEIQLIGLKCTTKYMYPDSGEGTQEVLMTCKPNDVFMDMSGNGQRWTYPIPLYGKVFIKGDELWHPKLKGESGKEKRDSDPEVLGYHPFFDVRAGKWGIAGIKGKGLAAVLNLDKRKRWTHGIYVNNKEGEHWHPNLKAETGKENLNSVHEVSRGDAETWAAIH